MRNVSGLIRGAGLAGLATMLLLAGCSDSTGEGNPPADPSAAGNYTMNAPVLAFDGRVIEPEQGDFDLRVVATEGTLELASDSTYEYHARLDTYVDEVFVGKKIWQDHGDWRPVGDSLHFDSQYIEGLTFKGSRTGASMKLILDMVGEGTTAHFPFERQP